MSATIDTNILLYAANATDPVHAEASRLLDRLARGPEILYLFWPVIMGFVRIATSVSVFASPLSPEEALDRIEDLLSRPHVRTPGEGPRFLEVYRRLAPAGTRGRLVPDAHLAALTRQHGVALIYTRDRGFRRFDGVKVVDPFV